MSPPTLQSYWLWAAHCHISRIAKDLYEPLKKPEIPGCSLKFKLIFLENQ